MTLRDPVRIALAIAALALAMAGCGRPSPTQPWPPNTDPLVFGDASGSNVGFQPFSGSKVDAVGIDSTTRYQGAAAIKVTVPGPGDPSGGYAGGAFVTTMVRDLSGYNALSFWVKGSRAVNLETAGFGNDNTGTSRYEAKRSSIPVTTNWTEVLVPIPLPARLQVERGLFFFAEGPQAGQGLTLWFDEVRFVNVSTISNPRPLLARQTLNLSVGASASLEGATRTTFRVGGVDQTVVHQPGYFTFTSSDPAVATVGNGFIHAHGNGTARISAKLGAVAAADSITVIATAPPATAAPAPTLPASDVISLYSDAYADVAVDTWSASWDQADVADVTIAGNPTKAYSNLVFSGIEFTSHPIDASQMTAFHMDVWVPSGTTFRVKLVDFGPNGVFGTDDSESELTFNADSTPALATGQWVSLEVPMANFTGLAARAHLAQLILSGDTRIVYLDNVYFHE